jgi:thiol:disulfide interchange protein
VLPKAGPWMDAVKAVFGVLLLALGIWMLERVAPAVLTMALWALFIVLATGLSMATLMLGFIVLYPLMGHASWHAYRDLVGDDAVVPTEPAG